MTKNKKNKSKLRKRRMDRKLGKGWKNTIKGGTK